MKSNVNPGLILTALATIAILGGLGLAKGGLYMNLHEGDVMHLLEIVMRLAEGQRPHIDFSTPIGVLATWPIALFVQAGLGLGMAVLAAQIVVALVLLPAVLRAAHSRFDGGLAYVFTVVMLVLPLALVHGGAEPNISLSMHYNRWAWAFALVGMTLAFLAPRRAARPGLDGVLIGVLFAVVVLIKVTYVVALAPALIAALLLRGAGRVLVFAVAAGLATLALATLFLGLGFWPAYVGDLLTVARSDIRAHPDLPLNEMMTAPSLLGAHLLALFSVVLLRQGRVQGPGLALLILLPGFVYITYQNFGNDPQWVLWLALVLLMVRPAAGVRNGWGWDIRAALGVVAVGLFAAGSASFLNLAYSPLRHASVDATDYAQLFPRAMQNNDIFYPTKSVHGVMLSLEGQDRFAAFAASPEVAQPHQPGKPTVLANETLETCGLLAGMASWFDQTTRTLEAEGYGNGAQIMVADLLSNLPLFSDQLSFVVGGAPWRYDGLPGIAEADYILVPMCAVVPRVRQLIVQQLGEQGIPLREVFRNEMFILLENGAQSPALASIR